MTVWRKNMLAVFVRPLAGPTECLPVGTVRKVTGVVHGVLWDNGEISEALTLEGVGHTNQCGGSWHGNFRPAVSDDKAADTEFAQKLDDILKGRVPADMSA